MPWLVLLSLLALPADPAGQSRSAGAISIGTSSTRAQPFSLDRNRLGRAIEARKNAPHSTQGGSPDSLSNGIIIGAIVGAAALGTVGGVICKAMQEPGNPSCVGDTLRIAAIGAAIGVGAGIAIDAALARNAGVRVSLGIRF